MLKFIIAIFSLSLFASFTNASEIKNFKEIKSLTGKEVSLKANIIVSYGIEYKKEIGCYTDSLVISSSNETPLQYEQTWEFYEGANLKIESATTFSQSGLFRLEDGNKALVEVRIKATGINSENEKKTFGLICYSRGRSVYSKSDAQSKAVRLMNDLFDISKD